MSQHYRIVLIALVIGLILALAVIFFIPEQIPGGTKLFAPTQTKNSGKAQDTDNELLKNIDDEMGAIDQEYNFNTEPATEDLESPVFATNTSSAVE